MNNIIPKCEAECRGCGKKLKGSPYYAGGTAFDPDTGVYAKVCFYGGWVCSRDCDVRACLALERTMPGYSGNKKSPSMPAQAQISKNWSN